MNTWKAIHSDEQFRKDKYILTFLRGCNSWTLHKNGDSIDSTDQISLHTAIKAQQWADEIINKREGRPEMSKRTIPTKEQVLEAAKRCPQTKEALEILFPEDFKNAHTQEIKHGSLWRYNSTICLVMKPHISDSNPEGYLVFGLNSGGYFGRFSKEEIIEKATPIFSNAILRVNSDGKVIDAEEVLTCPTTPTT